VYETYWKVLYYFQICAQTTRLKAGGVKQMLWANNLFQGLGEKSSLITRLAAITNAEIIKRISESVTSCTIEMNEDAFKHDTIFDSFHH